MNGRYRPPPRPDRALTAAGAAAAAAAVAVLAAAYAHRSARRTDVAQVIRLDL